MRFGWWKKKKSAQLAGVDIGSSSVKVVELRRKGKGLDLLAAGIAELESGWVSDGEIRNVPAVSGVLSRLLEERGVMARDVATSVAGNAVMVRRIAVPEAEGGALGELIVAEAQQQFSSDVSELNIDYQVLGPGMAPKTLDVMLVAARREMIARRAEVVAAAGRNLAVVDLDAFAVQTAFEAAYQPASGKSVALVNLGASLINLSIVRDGAPVFTRDTSAGAQYTAALQKSLDVSASEAEALKKGKEGAAVAEAFLGASGPAREAFLDSLAGEVRRTVSYFRQMAGPTGHAEIDLGYVSGGAASLPGLCERLQQELGARVEILDPLRGMRVSDSGLDSGHLSEIAPRLAVAVGLALRSFDAP
jgi:type IV pilus assembly protein PilM